MGIQTSKRSLRGQALLLVVFFLVLAGAAVFFLMPGQKEKEKIVISKKTPPAEAPAPAAPPEKTAPVPVIPPQKPASAAAEIEEAKPVLPALQEIAAAKEFWPKEVRVLNPVPYTLLNTDGSVLRQLEISAGTEVGVLDVTAEGIRARHEGNLLTLPAENTDLVARFVKNKSEGIRPADPEKTPPVAVPVPEVAKTEEEAEELPTRTGQTVGSGSLAHPAKGPAPAYRYEKATEEFVLVKNWDFGSEGTIQTMKDLSRHFQYHDQFGTIANGENYGAVIVSPDRQNALPNQPVEGVNTDGPVRELTGSSLKTYVVPLNGAKEVHPTTQKGGCGSFQAKWTLPHGGSLLGMDLLWETRVRYDPPPYFWFAIWTAGNKWNKGAEMDVVESFGYDNGGGNTNYKGRYWHSDVVGGTWKTPYHLNWGNGMADNGIRKFDASEYHVWTWIYRADNSYTAYVDGKEVQKGTLYWTLGAKENGEPINMSFLFDGSWGHSQVGSINHPLKAADLKGTFYEWDYSRVYLRRQKSP
jgi:hypothetical protein